MYNNSKTHCDNCFVGDNNEVVYLEEVPFSSLGNFKGISKTSPITMIVTFNIVRGSFDRS